MRALTQVWISLGFQDGVTQTGSTVASDAVGPLEWALAASILSAGFVLSLVVRWAIVRLLRKGVSTEEIAERLVGRLAQIVVVMIAMSYSLTVLEVRIGPLLGALGIGGIAVALALQEVLKNLFAGVILHAQRPVRIGDEVETGDMQGTVIDITSRSVTLRSNSGRTMFVPNSLMLDREIVNLVRHGVRRTTLVVGVAYGTDLVRAREVILETTVALTAVLPEPAARVLCSGFAESSVDFDIDFWHGPTETERRVAASDVAIAVHRALEGANITIPFPQRTIWMAGDSQDSKPTASDEYE